MPVTDVPTEFSPYACLRYFHHSFCCLLCFGSAIAAARFRVSKCSKTFKSNDTPAAYLDTFRPSLSLRSDDELSILYIRAHTEAYRVAKAAKAATHKAGVLSKLSEKQKADHAAKAATHRAAGLSKTPDQRQKDHQNKKEAKAARADKAREKPNFKSHERKMIQKGRQIRKAARKAVPPKITFARNAEARLHNMGLRGKDLHKAKNFHTYIMKSKMDNNGAVKGKIVYAL